MLKHDRGCVFTQIASNLQLEATRGHFCAVPGVPMPSKGLTIRVAVACGFVESQRCVKLAHVVNIANNFALRRNGARPLASNFRTVVAKCRQAGMRRLSGCRNGSLEASIASFR